MPEAAHAALGPAAMRAVMRAFDEEGGKLTYHVLFGRVTCVGTP